MGEPRTVYVAREMKRSDAPDMPMRRFTRREYERLVEDGFFRADERLELLDGLLVVREPQGTEHATARVLVHSALRRAFQSGFHVREQSPVALDRLSEPEPDFAVVPGEARDYLGGHPSQPALLVEIALSTLSFDRLRKLGLYARARRQEYWIVNLRDRLLEVYRRPVRNRAALYGWSYDSARILKPGATVSPLAAPRSRIRVADLLP